MLALGWGGDGANVVDVISLSLSAGDYETKATIWACALVLACRQLQRRSYSEQDHRFPPRGRTGSRKFNHSQRRSGCLAVPSPLSLPSLGRDRYAAKLCKLVIKRLGGGVCDGGERSRDGPRRCDGESSL